MTPRLHRLPAVVDARGFCDPTAPAWLAQGPIPSVFEFARTCGVTGRLIAGDGAATNARVAAILYLGGGLFDGPGAERARFGVLLRVRGRLPPAAYRFEVPLASFPALADVPIHRLVPGRARALRANHYFLVR
ncbi:MAG: hypothetical protein GC202_02900 [Alphaproteobacteria bacterium]|nr:hypothetical protein [Alphaproteobacteria bacterium]